MEVSFKLSDKPLKVRFNVRPVRIAYFLREDDATTLKKVLQLVSTQWGGIYHLIIPLSETIAVWPLYAQWLQLYDPDLFVAFLSESERAVLANGLVAILPNRTIEIQDGNTFDRFDHTRWTLSMLSPEERASRRVDAPRIEAGDVLEELINLAVFGNVYPGQEGDYEPLAIIRPLALHSQAFWQSQMDAAPFSSLINLTSYRTDVTRVTNMSSMGGVRMFDAFTLVVVDSVAGICLYWNLRSIQEVALFRDVRGKDRRVVCVPLAAVRDSELFQQLFSEIENRLFFPGRNADIDIHLVSLPISTREEVEAIIRERQFAKPLGKASFAANTLHFGRNVAKKTDTPVYVRRPLNYLCALPPQASDFLEGVAESEISFSLFSYGQNDLLVELPSGFPIRDFGQVVLDVECDIWQRYPRRPGTEGLVSPGSRFTRYGLSITTDVTRHISLKLPDERAALIESLEQGGYQIKRSKLSQYSAALIELVGGIDKLAILSQPQSIRLLQWMASLSTDKLAQRLYKSLELQRVVHSVDSLSLASALRKTGMTSNVDATPRSFEQIISNDEIRANKTKGELLQTIDQLCSIGILQRGYYLDCPLCGQASWYSLQDVGEQVFCPGCRYKYQLPVCEPHNPDQSLQWRYRLNPLVDRVLDQDALVGLLASHALAKMDSNQHFGHLFGLQVFKGNSDDPVTDLDFVFVSQQEIVIGECKAGARLVEKDYENARLAASLGCSRYYFCSMRGFDQNTLTEIDTFKSEFEGGDGRRKLHVLQRADLFGES